MELLSDTRSSGGFNTLKTDIQWKNIPVRNHVKQIKRFIYYWSSFNKEIKSEVKTGKKTVRWKLATYEEQKKDEKDELAINYQICFKRHRHKLTIVDHFPRPRLLTARAPDLKLLIIGDECCMNASPVSLPVFQNCKASNSVLTYALFCFTFLNLGCLLFTIAGFLFDIYRLLFTTLLAFVSIWTCLVFTSSALFVSGRRSVRLSAPIWHAVHCFARFWWRVLLSCRLTRLYLISISFCFGMAVLVIFRTGSHWLRPTYSFVLHRGRTIEILVESCWVLRLHTACPLFRKVLMTYSIVLQITSADLNTVQFSICFKDGVSWRLHGRLSSFWTSPGPFRRIVAMSKPGVGDVSLRMTPGMALWGGKQRRKYFSSLHLTRWTDHFEPETCFILALYRNITSSAVLLKS